MAKQKLVGKLSAKSVGVNFAKAKEAPMDHFDVIGYATGVKEGESTYGKWFALEGNFEARNLETDQVYVSAKCFLPPIVNNLVAVQVQEGKSVQFAYRVGTIPANTVAGYEYTIEALVEAEPLEILENIKSKIDVTSSTPAALTAPEKPSKKK